MRAVYKNGEVTYINIDEGTPEEVDETATQEDRIEAQVMYTALMTDTLLEEE